MATTIIAGLLLVIRLVVVYYLVRVLKVQINLLRRPIEPEVWDFRKALHYMTLAFGVANIIPIVLDSFVVLQGLGIWEHTEVEALIHVYAISNALAALLVSILIQKIYALASYEDDVDKLERRHVADKESHGTNQKNTN